MDSSNAKDTDARECDYQVVEYADGDPQTRSDLVVVEEPVEIRVVFGPANSRTMRSISITMRTPASSPSGSMASRTMPGRHRCS